MQAADLASTFCTTEQQRFVLKARRSLLDELLVALLERTPLLALTGQSGAGKTTLASALEQELVTKAVDVLWIGRGERGCIDLRTLACQLVGKPETEFTTDDVEGVFNALTADGQPGHRRVIIIDEAETLRSDALGYLHLLSNLVGDAMPQIVFVGEPSFLEADPESAADLRSRITFHRHLTPLTEDEAGLFLDQSESTSALGPDVRAALIRHADGSIGRLASLLAAAEAFRTEQHRRAVTEAMVGKAAAGLDGAAEPAPAAAESAPAVAEPAPAVAEEPPSEPYAADTRQAREQSRLVYARLPALVGVAVLLIAGLASWEAWERGVRLSTLATSLVGRDVNVVALSAPIATEAADNRASNPEVRAFPPVHGAPVLAAGGIAGSTDAPPPVSIPKEDTDSAADDTARAADAPPSPPAATAGEPTAAAGDNTPAAEAPPSPSAPTSGGTNAMVGDSAPATEVPPSPSAPTSGGTNAMVGDSALVTEAPPSPSAPTSGGPNAVAGDHVPVTEASPSPSAPTSGVPSTVAGDSAPVAEVPPSPSAPTSGGASAAVGDDVPAAEAPPSPSAPTSGGASAAVGDEVPAAEAPPSPSAPTSGGTNAMVGDSAPAAEAPPSPSAPTTGGPSAVVGDKVPAADAPSPASTPTSGKPSATVGDNVPAAEVPSSPPAPTSSTANPVAGNMPVGGEVSRPRPAQSLGADQAPAPVEQAGTQRAVSGQLGGGQDAGRAPAAGSAATIGAEPAPAPTGRAVSQEKQADGPAAVAARPAAAMAAVPAQTAVVPVNFRPIISRGDELLASGDVIAARLYYEHAAALGSGAAATSLGKTYDPVFLAAIHANGVLPDRDRATSWYRKAVGLGDGEAERLLARLGRSR